MEQHERRERTRRTQSNMSDFRDDPSYLREAILDFADSLSYADSRDTRDAAFGLIELLRPQSEWEPISERVERFRELALDRKRGEDVASPRDSTLTE